MTRDEHRDIIAFIEGAVRQADGAEAPLDVEADAIIRALFVRNPDAAYRVTMLAMAQRDALAQAKAEIVEMRSNTRNWLARLWGRPSPARRDPSMTMVRSR